MKELGLPLGFKNIPAAELEEPEPEDGRGKTKKKKRSRKGKKKVITKDLAQVGNKIIFFGFNDL